MTGLIDPILDSVDTLLAWFSSGLATTIASNCDIQTADGPSSLVTNDGSLCTVMKVDGVTSIIGKRRVSQHPQRYCGGFLRSCPLMDMDYRWFLLTAKKRYMKYYLIIMQSAVAPARR